MSKIYNFKAIIIDFEDIFSHFKKLSRASLVSFIDDNLLEDILTSPELKELEAFLFSIIQLNLFLIIVVSEGKALIQQLINSWKTVEDSSFKIQILDRTGIFSEENIISRIKEMDIAFQNTLIIGKSDFFSEFEFLTAASTICLSEPSLHVYSTFKKYDFTLNELQEIVSVIRKGVLLSSGKLPNEFLQKLLSEYKFEDPSVIVGPAVGEDTAAVEIRDDEVLILKTDPITFTTDNIGYYAVLVNSNDIATSGTVPKWMLTTLMLPPNISVYSVEKIFEELYKTCSSLGITLCGGHTEITDAVSRPVVVGTMAGTVKRKNLLNKRNVGTGDLLILTKKIAIEGTAVLASRLKKMLLNGIMSADEIGECLDLRMKISVLTEAKISWENDGVSALHDVTEGGISTAITELSKASGYGIDISLDAIPIYNHTEKICDFLDINAFGLIASGSLLICCRRDNAGLLLKMIRGKDIFATVIGTVTEKNCKIRAFRKGIRCQFPFFEVDEIAKIVDIGY